MQRTHIYLPEEINREIGYIAKQQRKTKAQVVREVLSHGIEEMKPRKSSSTEALLKMAKEAKKFTGTGPKDLSINHDHYTWGGPKREPKAEV
ncbi:MAG: hypothetical protein Q7K55_09035 [Candidatus Levybacteria bacterium]|nr:hypothetical protein [Candidatus Levybacteria bacterium]